MLTIIIIYQLIYICGVTQRLYFLQHEFNKFFIDLFCHSFCHRNSD